LITSRVSIKSIYNSIFQIKSFENKILIYGAGELGQMAQHAIKSDYSLKSKVVAFIDDNSSLHGKRIGGIPVISLEKAFKTTATANDITEVIIAIAQDRLNKTSKRKVVDLCIESGIRVREIPVVSSWIGNELKSKHFKDIEIEDLLGRDAISLDKVKIKEGVKNSIVLVTGAAGSIGSEIVRQLISFNAKQVILLDQAESPLYDLQNEIIAANNNPNFEVVIASVTNKKKIRRVFEKYRPNIVFNAAAYKHVPLMEEFPGEAIHVNIGGTKILADLSVEFGVEKFVFISTDKAVNPSNVMGASKRLSELYIQSLAQNNGISTKFITTRFGNVLGSNGSVVPLFKKQIKAGGPITLTHKEIERFFMTIPEACQLVLEAGFMGKGGEIFIFDMGNPVKIIHLAEKMISLSGLIPNKDIEIKVTGLRPGEKLYEELMNGKEELQPTYNDKIMIGKFEEHNYMKINWAIIKLINSVDELEDSELVAQLKAIVPEFVSKNSAHAVLDEVKERKDINGSRLYNTRKAILAMNGKRKKIASFLTI
jgi:FlaA1/EpsC-like NDP-sugar epimerase